MTRPDDYARLSQHFETIQCRAEQARRNDDRAYRNWRLTLMFCAASAAVIIALIAGMAALHLFAVAAATLADPLANSPY